MEPTIATTGTATSTAAPATAAADAATAAVKRPLTPGELVFNYLLFGMSVVLTAAFAYYLVTEPSRLTDAWAWIRALPLLVQLVLWLLFLPWMVALWVLAQPWALALRLVIVIGTLLFAEYLLWPWKP